ncbi:MAG: sigma-70 family RNA polymerase sigma factor [Clostridia bacterium]|nr:sigma-70 family RNA polymerase sigma factor [Clostridia bacterium]
MAKFSMEQFHTMLEELADEKGAKFDMALEIAETLLRKKLEFDHGEQVGQEIMQEVCLIVYQRLLLTRMGRTLKDETLSKEERAGRYGAWLKTVAVNCANTYYRKRSKEVIITPDDVIHGSHDPFEDGETSADLRKAFDVVINATSEIYITLAWLGVHVFMVTRNTTKIDTTNYVVEEFSKLTLEEYYEEITDAAEFIEWLSITREQKAKLRAALEKTSKLGIPYGKTVLDDHYMAKGGAASISDWINKFNGRIKDKLNYKEDKADYKKKDKSDDKSKNKKQRGDKQND